MLFVSACRNLPIGTVENTQRFNESCAQRLDAIGDWNYWLNNGTKACEYAGTIQGRTKLMAVRIDAIHCKILDKMASAGPDRITPLVLVRRAIRQYLEREGRLDVKP